MSADGGPPAAGDGSGNRVHAGVADVDRAAGEVGIDLEEALAGELRNRDQPLRAIERRALDPRQRLPRFHAAQHRHERGAAGGEGEGGGRQMQVDGNHRGARIARRRHPDRRRDETRRAAVAAPHPGAVRTWSSPPARAAPPRSRRRTCSATRRASREMPSLPERFGVRTTTGGDTLHQVRVKAGHDGSDRVPPVLLARQTRRRARPCGRGGPDRPRASGSRPRWPGRSVRPRTRSRALPLPATAWFASQ